MIGRVNPRGGRTAAAALALGVAVPVLLAACGGGPSPSEKAAVRSILTTTSTSTTTTTSTTSSTSTTTSKPGAEVPNVAGEKIPVARGALRAAGFHPLSLNTACDKGTTASESVVSSLAVPGKPPNRAVGAVALNPGPTLPLGSSVGIVWSGCYGNGSTVPYVVGMKFADARHALALAGLAWSCYSVGRPATTTTTTTSTSLPSSSTTTTTRPPNLVLSQAPDAGAVLKPGATVALTMHACPQ
jgi:beta-lactam-binding protein with PASTA domain